MGRYDDLMAQEWTAQSTLEIVKVLLAHKAARVTILAVIERFDAMNAEAQQVTEQHQEMALSFRDLIKD